jgi:hypothetical protein
VGRLHLFELEDQSWCPGPLRDGMTDWLRFMSERGGGFDGAAPLLARVVRQAGAIRLVDLCSGGVGPALRLRRLLAEREGLDVELVLTDLYPNRAAFERAAASSERVRFREEPVDATDVPRGIEGLRTLFAAFHHFRPDDARSVLAHARAQRQPIAVFEATSRTAASVLVTLFSPLIVLFTTPFVRPFRWSRMLLTYVVPLIPLAVLWDGLVSCLRTYSVAELEELARRAGGERFHWEAGSAAIAGTPVHMSWLLGWPAETEPEVAGSNS